MSTGGCTMVPGGQLRTGAGGTDGVRPGRHRRHPAGAGGPLHPQRPESAGRAAAHWFAGDGMVHGIRLRDGRAEWYRNR